ncbi:MAG TPA: response regulator transcription factor [Microthrixaceae bacterium]|nr:response regulator transcription factor [Microthrixaceae bacterium]
MSIRVMVSSNDPVLEVGIAAQLRGRREVQLVEGLDLDTSAVAIVAADELSEPTLRLVRAVQRDGCPRVVVIVARLDESGVLDAIEAGACAMLRTGEATPERIVEVVGAAASGAGSLPPDLLGRLLDRVGRIQRGSGSSCPFGALSERETDVLKLVADGFDTSEIAHKLSYSERTIKGIIHDVTTRLQLRNRTHAVAFAVREGLI